MPSAGSVRRPFDLLMHSADPALVVVTTALLGERAGCLVSFHAQSSLDPERYCVWLSRQNQTYDVARASRHLAVHFLASGQADLARHFGERSGHDVEKFSSLAWVAGPDGVPVLEACPRWLVLRKVAFAVESGDHACLTGDVVDASCPEEFVPLRFSGLQG